MDHAWSWHNVDAGDIRQAHLLAGPGINQEVLDVVEVSAEFRASPDHDVEHLLLLEQAAHRDAADQRRRVPAHVTGLETVGPGFLEIDLDLDLLLLGLLLDLRALDPRDLRENLTDLLCLGAENAQIFAVDADGDCLILAGQALAHLLGEEGLYLAADSSLGADDRLHGCQRGLVVGLGVQAHPDLGRIYVDQIMRQQRTANLRGRVAHPRDRAQIMNQGRGDAIHRLQGCARRRLHLDEYVGLLEGGDQRLFLLRPDQYADQDATCRERVGKNRRAHRRPDPPAIERPKPAHES